MMPGGQIRRARLEDFERVAELWAELGRTPLTEERRAPQWTAYQDYVASPARYLWLAEAEDGALVGFLSMEIRHRLGRVHPEAWIPDLVVAESHRRQGWARRLLSTAFEAAQEAGCWNASLESGNGRSAAHALYSAEGMESNALHFTRQFHPDAGRPDATPR